MADPRDRYFYGNKDPESNFYAVPGGVVHRGLRLPTSEHHFMHQKALIMGDLESAAKIAAVATPAQAKKLGGKVSPFHEALWDEIRENVMLQILVDKFHDPALSEYLLGIEGSIFEASSDDIIWGIGVDKKRALSGAEHHGRNLLGKCLMRVRALKRERSGRGALQKRAAKVAEGSGAVKRARS
jgi:hypothetical protein